MENSIGSVVIEILSFRQNTLLLYIIGYMDEIKTDLKIKFINFPFSNDASAFNSNLLSQTIRKSKFVDFSFQ